MPRRWSSTKAGWRRRSAISWSYAELWERANAVARALIASGTGKGTRVGILMTNRPEFISADVRHCAGGRGGDDDQHLLDPGRARISAPDLGRVGAAARTAGAQEGFCTRSSRASTGQGCRSSRHVASIGGGRGLYDWEDFLAAATPSTQAQVDARAATNTPADPGALFFSSGSTARPKGILSSHRGVTLQLWRWPGWYQAKPGELRMWPANGFSWSGNFGMCLGGALTRGGSIVLQATFDPEEALA